MSEPQQPVEPAPPAPPAPPALPMTPQMSQAQTAQMAQDAAQQAQQNAQQAAQQAAQAATDGQSAAADGAGIIRIEGGDGKVITFGPDGMNVTQTGQAPPLPIVTIPKEAMIISISFFVMIVLVIVGWPIARAVARRMDRASVAPARVPADQTEQLRRIEQAVEAMAIEMERVSENQRFVTKMLSEGQPDRALLAAAESGRRVAEQVMPEVTTPR